MQLLTPRTHGYIDYLAASTFLAAPNLFGFAVLAATISYMVGVMHLILSLTTKYPMGIVEMIPFTSHGVVELLTSVSLVAIPWIFGFSHQKNARNFFVGSGLALFGTWLMSDYKSATVNNSFMIDGQETSFTALSDYYNEMSSISGKKQNGVMRTIKGIVGKTE